MNKHCITIFRLLILLITFFQAPAYTFGSPSNSKHVLVLHSYHQGFTWTDHITTGIQTAFQESPLNIQLFIEYMDTKRNNPSESFRLLKQTYKFRYSNQKIDLIIVSDNNAFDFLLKERDDLFPGVPIVFCGINNFEDRMILGQKGITGIVEDIDIAGTIQLLLRLHPDTTQIAVVNDSTPTGLQNQEKLKKTIPLFESSVEFLDMIDLSVMELKYSLSKLPMNSAVLLFTFHYDRTGRHLTTEEYLSSVTESSHVPVYGFWDQYMGLGITGGVVVNGKEHGRQAAAAAIRILKGRQPDSISVLSKSPNIVMLDFRKIKQFGILASELPHGSLITNKPESLYYRYKQVIWIFSAIISGLLFVIAVLMRNIKHRKRAEKNLRKAEASLIRSREELEIRVKERTEELTKINVALNEEVAERKKTEKELDLVNKEMEQMLNVTSHDLKTHLSAIGSYTRLLDHSIKNILTEVENKTIPTEGKDLLKTFINDVLETHTFFKANASKLDSLVKSLLNLSRSGIVELDLKELDMNNLINEVCDAFEFRFKQDGVKLNISKLPSCIGDESQINQVFSNLIDNALKFLSPEQSGIITIKSHIDNGQACYTIEDNGIGIAPDKQEKVFEIFYQINRQPGKGEGMGLALIRRIIERHNGTIWVESEPGIGSKFHVTMPCRKTALK